MKVLHAQRAEGEYEVFFETLVNFKRMNYSIKGNSVSKNNASVVIKETQVIFGTTPESADILANPAELLLASFAACTLKNVERFSDLMKFDYQKAEITVKALRLEKPPRMNDIQYELKIYSDDPKLNIQLLQKNIEKFGTIYNTIKPSCDITRTLQKIMEK